MKRFSKFIKESVELDEAVEVSHDRYMRSHGKKASGGHGTWMFTHKSTGDVDVNKDKEVHAARGNFSDAKKSAQQWAKRHGHSTVYVMEEVELDEGIKEKIGGIIRRQKQKEYPLLQNRRDVAVVKAAKAYAKGDEKKGNRYMAWRTNNMKKEEVELDELDKKTLGSYVKKAAGSAAGTASIATAQAMSSKGKADPEHLRKLRNRMTGVSKATDRLTKEEVELDEVSDKKLDAYRQKAFADQPSGDDGSDKYRKRKFGRDLAFAKQTGRAKVLATKEEVELDEVSKATLGRYVKAASTDAARKTSEKDSVDRDYPSRSFSDRLGYKKELGKKLNNRRVGISKAVDRLTKEEVDINEASDLRVTKVYNKFPKKATYAVHSPDRKYYKEFDTEADAKKHLETKK